MTFECIKIIRGFAVAAVEFQVIECSKAYCKLVDNIDAEQMEIYRANLMVTWHK